MPRQLKRPAIILADIQALNSYKRLTATNAIGFRYSP
jgi:hypothetical protein